MSKKSKRPSAIPLESLFNDSAFYSDFSRHFNILKNESPRDEPLIKAIEASMKRADVQTRKLSQLIHSDDISSIQGHLNEQPPNALTLIRLISIERDQLPSLVESRIKQMSSELGRKRAERRHGGQDGTRAKRERIKEIYATGKYTTKQRCAEEECEALGMSFDTARKALRNEPKPR